jgi:hypothetical protein
MCSSHNLRIVSLICLLAFAVVPAGFAATITWSGAGDTTNWFTTNNWFGNVVPTNTDDVLLTNGATVIVLPTNTTIRSLDITNRTLRFTGWPTTLTASNIILRNQATITHPANSATTTNASGGWDPNNGIYLVCSNLVISTGASINANGVGFGGGAATAAGYGPGHGHYNGANSGCGGGYGGQGMGSGSFAGGGISYGSPTNPVDPGSGGAGGASGTGGAGGGYINIVAAEAVTAYGNITANGNDGVNNFGGGGSGGGINLQCRTLVGNGSILADGGIGATGIAGGGGGGGRIFIQAADPANCSFSGNLSAKFTTNSMEGSYYRTAGWPGTIYLSDWRILPTALTNGGGGVFTAPTGMVSSLTISNYTVALLWGWETNRLQVAGDLLVKNKGIIKHVWNTATTTNPVSGLWDPNGGVFIACSNLTIDVGGEINADALGYGGGPSGSSSYGPGRANSGGTGGGGGAYGGIGAYSSYGDAGGAAYGVSTNPADPGSGGAGSPSGNYGGHGGGYIKIVASNAITVNGAISANGTNGAATQGGGGSGGGINLLCRVITGSGTISANGGLYSANGGSGGGGRILIRAAEPANCSFTGQLSAKGPTNGWDAAASRQQSTPGTIYLADWQILPTNLTGGGEGRFIATNGLVNNLTISNYALWLEYGWETNRLRAGTITVENGGKIKHLWNTASAAPWTPDGGVFIECTNLTVNSGCEINANGMGYSGGWNHTDGYGPGRGFFGNTYYGSGGSYGGRGGDGLGVAAGTTYGLSNNPAWPGSGGGGGYNGRAGFGGGYIQIVANGVLVCNGAITANGMDCAGFHCAGGSGGGIYLSCGTFQGSGAIRANGGVCNNGNGGGGGGGRIAILVRNAPYYNPGGIASFVPTVSPGTGYNTGIVGTVYTYFKPRGTVFFGW